MIQSDLQGVLEDSTDIAASRVQGLDNLWLVGKDLNAPEAKPYADKIT
jgi:hypothetical protein